MIGDLSFFTEVHKAIDVVAEAAAVSGNLDEFSECFSLIILIF